MFQLSGVAPLNKVCEEKIDNLKSDDVAGGKQCTLPLRGDVAPPGLSAPLGPLPPHPGGGVTAGQGHPDVTHPALGPASRPQSL